MPDNLRTSILIEDGEKGTLCLKLTRSPSGGPGKRLTAAMPNLRAPTIDGDAAAYGSDLRRKLFTARELKKALSTVLTAPDGQVWPLCFKIEIEQSSTEGKLLLEMLWVKDHEFLALQPKWPIARVGDSRTSSARVYQAPLRVLAIMSALGVSAREDWNGLHRAVQVAHELGLPVHVTAIVGEQSLLTDLQELARSQEESEDPAWLTVVGLQDQQTIDRHLVQPPHILHFFCHGVMQYGRWSLDLATKSDHADLAMAAPGDPDAPAVGSVVVDLATLRRMVSGSAPWLVTLNCCSGASTSGQTHSLAQNVVEAGAGAAMGWRTPVSPAEAGVLSRTVFDGVFRQIQDQLRRAQVFDLVSVEFASLGYELRRTLHSDYPDLLAWTLPVLYVAPEPLTVTVATLVPDDPKNLATLNVSAADSLRIGDAATNQVLDDFTRALPELGSALAATLNPARAAGPAGDGVA